MANVELKIGFPLVLIILRTLHFVLCSNYIKHPWRNLRKMCHIFQTEQLLCILGGESLQEPEVFHPLISIIEIYKKYIKHIFKNHIFTSTSLSLNISLYFSFVIRIFLEKR